jgi:hypothetical protein
VSSFHGREQRERERDMTTLLRKVLKGELKEEERETNAREKNAMDDSYSFLNVFIFFLIRLRPKEREMEKRVISWKEDGNKKKLLSYSTFVITRERLMRLV